MNLIDVIIPAYNCASTIAKTVDSIQNSNLIDFSIIIVDDGSTDNTRQVCQHLLKNHSNIRFVHQPNSGVSAARNRGLQEATSEYVLFIDSDDALRPFDSSITQILQNTRPDMLIFGMQFQYLRNNTIIRQQSLVSDFEGLIHDQDLIPYWNNLFSINYFTPVWNKFFRRNLLNHYSISFDSRLTNYEDLAFTIHVLSNSDSIYISNQPYYIYHVDYDHDHTIDRIAKIDDIIGNTDLICERFLELEKRLEPNTGFVPTIRSTLIRIYFEIFQVKMKTTPLAMIKQYCRDFNQNAFLSSNLELVNSVITNKKLLNKIRKEQSILIWLNTKYYIVRHFIARTLKYIVRRLSL